MDWKENTAILKSIETEFDVWNIKYKNIELWPIIKMELGNILYTEKAAIEVIFKTPNNKKSAIHRIKDLYWICKIHLGEYLTKRQLLSIDKKNNIGQVYRANFLFYEISSHRSVRFDNRYYNRISDSFHFFLVRFGKIFHSESVVDQLKYPRYNKSKIIDHKLVLYDFIFQLKKTIFKTDFAIENLDLFISYLKIKNIHGFDKNNFILRVEKILAYSKFFKKLLLQVQPKLLLLDIYYHDRAMAAILAAKELKILSVDMQHGVQGIYHFAYSNWNKMPVSGTLLLPDVFWVWDTYSFATIANWSASIKNHKPILGGHPLISLMNNGRLSLEIPEPLLKRIKKTPVVILITLASTAQPELDFLKILSQVMDKFNENEILWIFRCHPEFVSINKEVLQNVLIPNNKTNIQIHAPAEINLYGLLAHVNIHLTYISTVCMEAQTYNIKNIIWGSEGYSFYKDYITSGAFDYADTREVLYSLLKDNTIKKVPKNEIVITNMDLVYHQIEQLLSMAKGLKN